MAVFPILCTWRSTRGLELHPENVSVNHGDLFSGPLKNRTFLYTMAMFAASNVALGASGSVAVYFMKYYMLFDETQQSIAYFFLFTCTILWIPLINWSTARFGKRQSYIFFISLWAAVQAIGVMLIQPSMTWVYYAMMVLASGGIVSVSLTGLSMIPDAIEVDEFKSGQRREGLYVGINMFAKKFSTALVLWLVGIALSNIGYVPDQVQSDQTLLGIRLLYALGTAFFLVLSVILAIILPMNRERHLALRKAIELKKMGKSWDETQIKPLL
jgi:oligogalacturonide transporter